MFQVKSKTTYIILLSILLIMIGSLFRESFIGLLLQGVDDNISMRAVIVRSLLSGQGYHFIPNYWIGFIFNIPNPDFYNSILAITGYERVVGVYILALILSGFVTFKLIRRSDVSASGAILGAISYTFLPHVLSLVYSGHALAIEAIPMTPAFLLCISVILDGKTDSKTFKILAGVWGGIFWAWMMIGEPQRGIYGTVLGFCWVLYLLYTTKSFSINTFFIQPKKELLIDFLKNKVSYLVLFLLFGLGIFFSTLQFWKNSEFLANQGSWEFATSWSFPPKELLDSFAFGYHGLSSSDPNFPYYGEKPLSGNTDSLGFFLMFFMICAVALAWKSNRKDIRFFTIAGGVALLLAFGKYFPGTPFFWLWYHLPGMDKMRVPAKFLSITGLCWSIVAAMGLDAVKTIFESNKQKIKQTFLIVLGAITIIVVMWFVLLFFTDGGDASHIRQALGRANRVAIDAALTGRINAVLNMALLFMTMFLMFIFIYYKQTLVKYFPIIVIVLTMHNLYISNRFYIERTYVDTKQFYPRTPLIQFLENNLGLEYRASGSLFLPNLTGSPHPMGSVIEQQLYPLNNNDLTYSFPYYDINMFGRIPVSRLDEGYVNFFKSAYDSISTFQNYDDIWEMNKRLWYIGNVKYLLVGPETQQSFAEQLSEDTIFVTNLIGSYNQPVSIYELKNKLPRFALVHNVKLEYDLYLNKSLTEALKNIEFFTLPIEDSGYDIKEQIVYQNPLPLIPQRENYNAYSFEVDIKENSIFYFGDLYDIGWNIKANETPLKIYRANGIQQYAYIPADTTKIELFYYRPVKGLLYAKIIISLAILFAIGVYIWKLIILRK